MKKPTNEKENLLALFDYYDEIIEEMSEKELEESIILDGDSPQDYARMFKSGALEAIQKCKKNSLKSARLSFGESINGKTKNQLLPLERYKKIEALSRVIEENPNLKTMAARGQSGSFSDMSNEELDVLLRQMNELGLWNENI